MSDLPVDWAAQLLIFWFDEHGRDDWFGSGPDFDAAIAAGFSDWRDTLRATPTDAFLTDAGIALAAVLLFDQVPRNIHRGHAESFATDAHALAIARAAIARGFDAGLDTDRALFLYLPFEHSEDIADQREAVRLIGSLGNEEYTRFALAHLAMIDRFGRFPHRNAALGRADRPGEAEAVAAGGGW
jgi:uncharacterized protein (DUF924 family)